MNKIQRPSINRLSRQKSFMEIQANPLESGEKKPLVELKVENISEAQEINDQELNEIVLKMCKAE